MDLGSWRHGFRGAGRGPAIRRVLLAVFLVAAGFSLVGSVLDHAAYVNYCYFEPGIFLNLGDGNLLIGQPDELAHLRLIGGVRVRGVVENRTAARAGIRPGDRIVKVNGVDLTHRPQAYYRPFARGRAGDRVDVVLEREGERREATIVLERIPPKSWGLTVNGVEMDFGPPTSWIAGGPQLVVGLFLLLVGALAALLGSRKPEAFDLAVMGAGFSWGVGSPDFVLIRSPSLALFAAGQLLGILAAVPACLAMLRLLARFPHPTRLGSVILRWQGVLAGAFLVLAGAVAARESFYLLGWPGPAFATSVPVRLLGGLGTDVVILFSILVALTLLVAQRIETGRSRVNRLRLIEAGFLAGGLGGILVELYYLWLSGLDLPPLWSRVIFVAGNFLSWLLVLLLPASLGYAILARKVPGLQLIVRRGIQYLLLSRGTLAAEGALVFLIVLAIARRTSQSGVVSETAASSIAAVSALVVVNSLARVNRRLMPVIDRRFFRERCDTGALLLDLGRQLPRLQEREKVLAHSAAMVSRALHPAEVVILTHEVASGDFRCETRLAGTSGRPSAREATLPVVGPPGEPALAAGDAVVRRLAAREPWVEVRPEELRPEDEEEARLDRLGGELLLGIESSEGLRAIMALGPKFSEEPFSREDKDLLQTVCRQIGLALENTELLQVAKREAQQARDLEIAHQVQQDLFPKESPVRPGWAFAGVCRPARATGGDYYDLLELPSGRIAFALGDVAGKGLGASLLTASVHAIVRSRLREEAQDLGRLMAEVNEHLYSASAPGMFVTLFVGVLDPDTGQLRFVNGGHPPPMLLGDKGGPPSRLEVGGPLVGVLPGAAFREQQVLLAEGSLLVLFSDGVTEATNSAEDMFEEERLQEVLAAVRDQDAEKVLVTVVEAVDRFASGCEQADDISLVVITRGGRIT